MEPTKTNPMPGRAASFNEARQLLAVCGKGAAGARNAAFIALTYGAALRCQEALDLKPRDITCDTNGCVIDVVCGKGGEPRKALMDPFFRVYLERWLERRSKLGINGHAPVICGITESKCANALGGSRGTKGKAVSGALMRATIARLAKKAGIQQRIHVHGMRHGWATESERAGMPLTAIQAQLGHKSLATTARYIAKHSVEDRLRFYASQKFATHRANSN